MFPWPENNQLFSFLAVPDGVRLIREAVSGRWTPARLDRAFTECRDARRGGDRRTVEEILSLPPRPEKPPEELLGSRVGSCRLEKVLGAGIHGPVFLARDRNEEPVAVKLLFPAEGDTALPAQARAVQEAALPGQVRLREVLEQEGRWALVYDYQKAGSLADRLPGGKGKPLPWCEACAWMLGAARALAELEPRGWTHAGLREECLYEEPGGRILLSGLAVAPIRTAPGNIFYCAPELVRDGRQDPAGDIYSLGALGYRLLGGMFPFDGNTPSEVLAHRLGRPPPPLRAQGVDFPEELSALVSWMMAPLPVHRPVLEDVITRLARWLPRPVGTRTSSFFLGEYEVGRKISSRGMAVRYASRDQEQGTEAELVLLPATRQGEAMAKRARPDAEVPADAWPVRVARRLCAGAVPGLCYVVEAPGAGRTLADLSEKNPGKAVTRIREVAETVAPLHRLGIPHRALRPGRILLFPGGARLPPVGLAATLEDEYALFSPTAWPEEAIFLAPEIFSGREANLAGDVYALGVMLFRALTGRDPSAGEVASGRILGREGKSLPRAFEEICLRVLAPRPEDRYPSAEGLAAALRSCRDDREGRPFPLLLRLRFQSTLALVLVALGAAWWWWLRPWPWPPEPVPAGNSSPGEGPRTSLSPVLEVPPAAGPGDDLSGWQVLEAARACRERGDLRGAALRVGALSRRRRRGLPEESLLKAETDELLVNLFLDQGRGREAGKVLARAWADRSRWPASLAFAFRKLWLRFYRLRADRSRVAALVREIDLPGMDLVVRLEQGEWPFRRDEEQTSRVEAVLRSAYLSGRGPRKAILGALAAAAWKRGEPDPCLWLQDLAEVFPEDPEPLWQAAQLAMAGGRLAWARSWLTSLRERHGAFASSRQRESSLEVLLGQGEERVERDGGSGTPPEIFRRRVGRETRAGHYREALAALEIWEGSRSPGGDETRRWLPQLWRLWLCLQVPRLQEQAETIWRRLREPLLSGAPLGKGKSSERYRNPCSIPLVRQLLFDLFSGAGPGRDSVSDEVPGKIAWERVAWRLDLAELLGAILWREPDPGVVAAARGLGESGWSFQFLARSILARGGAFSSWQRLWEGGAVADPQGLRSRAEWRTLVRRYLAQGTRGQWLSPGGIPGGEGVLAPFLTRGEQGVLLRVCPSVTDTDRDGKVRYLHRLLAAGRNREAAESLRRWRLPSDEVPRDVRMVPWLPLLGTPERLGRTLFPRELRLLLRQLEEGNGAGGNPSAGREAMAYFLHPGGPLGGLFRAGEGARARRYFSRFLGTLERNRERSRDRPWSEPWVTASWQAWAGFARLLEASGDREEASEAYRKALGLGGSRVPAEVLLRLSFLLVENGRRTEGEQFFKRALYAGGDYRIWRDSRPLYRRLSPYLILW